MQNSVKSGEIIELQIHGLTHSGDGVGRHENLAVFVPGALPGELVKAQLNQVKKSFARAELLEICEQAPQRINPSCQFAQYCGGCQLQHLDYLEQLAHKRSVVESALRRIGKLEDVTVLPTLGMEHPWHYRNKIHLQLGQEGNRIKLGFFAEGTYELAAILGQQVCLLVDQQINLLVAGLEQLINDYDLTPYHWSDQTGLLRHIVIRKGFQTGEMMVVLVTSGEPWPGEREWAKDLIKRYPQVVSVVRNINTSAGRHILGKEERVLFGRDYIKDVLNGLQFNISASSFYQVNPVQTELLYHKTLQMAGLTGKETVIDAYCGIGTIANFLAGHAKRVVGMEIVPAAVQDAQENAKQNGLRNTEFHTGPVEKLLPQMVARGLKPDLVVLDPPRKGCAREVLQAIEEAAVPKVVYVSCDPATLARDLGILAGMGYQTLQVQPVDMFPWTGHVECVAWMSRVV
ncbi:23S rRNA (uracil(1939)-C(5))-methyltransferase RlmD [Desulforamulus ferrireducens]|uniref:23S rRNA (Uracil(1939)-C(5))-methyltransferase RlmD n=1 Tax=Desulforamulus ferrireducens TaxID=1833852 RepID=A0A1S6IY15_9FIRM|nr:23S rRNA (uracil(1939)-C(5))-methyltransferase RlmD [Desulforamulus ferrireducens]AQS59675.1 23S rRNA (uracil(1939)-C(5))-methyltransferase RlmD [Desulforamulus ferrireducens]